VKKPYNPFVVRRRSLGGQRTSREGALPGTQRRRPYDYAQKVGRFKDREGRKQTPRNRKPPKKDRGVKEKNKVTAPLLGASVNLIKKRNYNSGATLPMGQQKERNKGGGRRT